ncbi:MAG: PP2C family protein-serine/threonine phosphatase [Planctomycetota bacterium]|jgi:sigma-B regulation protein RsbU (phosphoserine phosphatase)
MPGLDIAAAYIPCFDVGGDLYGFHQLDDNSIGVMIADVMGKGIPAAIMMSLFRGALKGYVDTVQDIPAYCDNKDTEQCNKDIINRINKMACDECRDGEFITMFHATIDVKNMTVTYCDCGHEPTVLIRGGQTIELKKGGLVLGVDPQAEYEVETVELRNGDCLVFYTDGLIDAANFDGELWGRERMLEAAKKFTSGTAEQMIKNILRYRRRFVGLARQIDDTSIVVVKAEKIKKQNGVWKD